MWCHSNSSGRPSADVGGKYSQRIKIMIVIFGSLLSFQVFLSDFYNLHILMWFQIFWSNRNNFRILYICCGAYKYVDPANEFMWMRTTKAIWRNKGEVMIITNDNLFRRIYNRECKCPWRLYVFAAGRSTRVAWRRSSRWVQLDVGCW